MSDQQGADQQDYDDLPDDVDPAEFQQMQAAVRGLYAEEYHDSLRDFAEEYPEHAASEEAATRLMQTAAQRAAELGAPHLSEDVRHLRNVARDLREEAQAEAAARPVDRTAEWVANVARPHAGRNVLPWG